MRNRLGILRILITVFFLGGLAHAQDESCAWSGSSPSHGVPINQEGADGANDPSECAPVPWPFPWAETCLVDWSGYEGDYIMQGAEDTGAVHIQIRVVGKAKSKWVRISRFTDDGTIVADGTTLITDDGGESMVRVQLKPAEGQLIPAQMAILKLYHATAEHSCRTDALIPGLTLDWTEHKVHRKIHYILVKAEPISRTGRHFVRGGVEK